MLATAAARSDVVQAWLVEEPRNPDALVMGARVLVERALQAHRGGHPGERALSDEAYHACRLASESVPADPVPWVCLLALAQLDVRLGYAEHWRAAWEPMLPAGPWGLLYRVRERDWGNREAYHRMLAFYYACAATSHADALVFAQWVASWAPEGSPLRILPLYVRMEIYRRRREAGPADPLLRTQWAQEPVIWEVHRAFQGWSEDTAGSLGDLNYLAHGLWAAHQYDGAAQVFRALGDYATRLPWLYVSDDPRVAELGVREFVRARSECLSPARSRTERQPAPRPRLV
ncbi:hypothetical protein [Streptomyces sp. NPDC023838]|uniref:hypothetical protein n=1 Tax=Streptomyces sp. NPDC023838 TaxID=3154325 RepID=UPI0033CC5F9A